MTSATTSCAQCGRRLSQSDRGRPYCSACRTAVLLPTASGFLKPASHFLRLFWGDIMALVAIAIFVVLLGRLLLEMIARNW